MSLTQYPFSKLIIEPTFLKKHPALWEKDSHFKAAMKIVSSHRVVNDTAERVLGKVYSGRLTKDLVWKDCISFQYKI